MLQYIRPLIVNFIFKIPHPHCNVSPPKILHYKSIYHYFISLVANNVGNNKPTFLHVARHKARWLILSFNLIWDSGRTTLIEHSVNSNKTVRYVVNNESLLCSPQLPLIFFNFILNFMVSDKPNSRSCCPSRSMLVMIFMSYMYTCMHTCKHMCTHMHMYACIKCYTNILGEYFKVWSLN